MFGHLFVRLFPDRHKICLYLSFTYEKAKKVKSSTLIHYQCYRFSNLFHCDNEICCRQCVLSFKLPVKSEVQ